jgi:hypothetical protein
VVGFPGVKALFVVVLSFVAVPIASGCGHCDGAIRSMDVWRGLEPDDDTGDEIGPDAYFRIGGDGPNEDSEELLRISGIDEQSWQLLDANGQPVEAEVRWWAGGHMCRYGVAFELRPEAPLEAGGHTLVLWLDAVQWPLVGEAKSLQTTRDDRRVLQRTYVVAP